jgi:hypothetical protein
MSRVVDGTGHIREMRRVRLQEEPIPEEVVRLAQMGEFQTTGSGIQLFGGDR